MFGKTTSKADLQIYAVYDVKAKKYRDPMHAPDHWDIVRDYEGMVRKGDNVVLVTNAEDFQIFKIGEYSREKGAITPCHPEHILNLHELKNSVLDRISNEPRTSGH